MQITQEQIEAMKDDARNRVKAARNPFYMPTTQEARQAALFFFAMLAAMWVGSKIVK